MYISQRVTMQIKKNTSIKWIPSNKSKKIICT